ncbi:MAG: phage holin family protein [Rhizonema sp. NSF051]|nr:phage holin family protein [Rhizonema sp. NSF051]
MDIRKLFIVWVVTSVSLYLVNKLPLGVEIDTPGKALMSAAVLGILSASVRPVLRLTFSQLNFVSFDLLSGFITFIFGILCFGIIAYSIQGFRLRFGIWSAITGAFALSIISSLIYTLLNT